MKLALLFLCSFAFMLFNAQEARAVKIDLLDYFLSTLNQGNSITTGEFFKVINHGDGTFTVQKSTDPAYYEKFRYDGNYIYHIEDTTWATDAGDVTCSQSGNTAKLAYSAGNQGIKWIAREMEVGECTDSSGEIIGVDEITGNQCTTAHNGTFNQRRMCLDYQGCVKFPNGTASADAIVLEIKQGPGQGEQFFYDADRGWIGFNRGEGQGDSGAYMTEDLSAGQSLSDCREVKIKPAFCPRGYTCPDTSNKVIFGETIKYEKKVFGEYGGLSGPTGPTQNDLHFPDFTQEEGLLMDSEIIARSMPFELLQKHFPNFTFPNLQGILGHSGCEKVTVNDVDAGDARIKNDEKKRFPTTPSYNKLLLGLRFWESQYVDGKAAQLKYAAGQPGDPDIPEHRPGCNDKDGESYQEATTVGNPTPPKNSLLTDIGGLVSQFVCSLGEGLGVQICATVKINVQQEKYLPGEIAFSEQSHNFLGSFIPFEQKGQPIDQEETNSYQVFSEGRVEGVNYLGAKTAQEKTLELVKSLRPYEETLGITTLGGTFGIPEATKPEPGLNYTIDYKNPNAVKITQETKDKIIKFAKGNWPNTKIELHWDTVVNVSSASNINPAFAIAVWLGESGAGHYPSQFSCPPKETDFGKSFDCFIQTTNNPQITNFPRWVRNYCGTPEDQPICTNDKNNHFIDNLKGLYDIVVPPGSPGAAQPL